MGSCKEQTLGRTRSLDTFRLSFGLKLWLGHQMGLGQRNRLRHPFSGIRGCWRVTFVVEALERAGTLGKSRGRPACPWTKTLGGCWGPAAERERDAAGSAGMSQLRACGRWGAVCRVYDREVAGGGQDPHPGIEGCWHQSHHGSGISREITSQALRHHAFCGQDQDRAAGCSLKCYDLLPGFTQGPQTCRLLTLLVGCSLWKLRSIGRGLGTRSEDKLVHYSSTGAPSRTQFPRAGRLRMTN
jgi:hypothetical protein